MKLDIPNEHLATFVACLAIGTLQAIRDGAAAPSVGIWTLGPPGMWEPLMGASPALDEVAAVLQEFDELSAMQKLMPDELDGVIGTLIARLEAVVHSAPDPAWRAKWDMAR